MYLCTVVKRKCFVRKWLKQEVVKDASLKPPEFFRQVDSELKKLLSRWFESNQNNKIKKLFESCKNRYTNSIFEL